MIILVIIALWVILVLLLTCSAALTLLDLVFDTLHKKHTLHKKLCKDDNDNENEWGEE
jgi:hypothetical protein